MRLQDNEKVLVSPVLTDEAGETVDHPITYYSDGGVGESGDPVITVDVQDDGSVWVLAGDIGTAVLTATEEDPDTVNDPTDAGVTATLDFEVVASDATSLQLVPGTPEHK